MEGRRFNGFIINYHNVFIWADFESRIIIDEIKWNEKWKDKYKLWIYIIQSALASCIRSFLPSNWCFLIPIQYPMLSFLHIHMHTYKYIVNINTQNPIYVFSSINQNPNSQVGKRMSLYIICPTRKWHPSHPSIAYWFPNDPPNARRDPFHFFYSFESCLVLLGNIKQNSIKLHDLFQTEKIIPQNTF